MSAIVNPVRTSQTGERVHKPTLRIQAEAIFAQADVKAEEAAQKRREALSRKKAIGGYIAHDRQFHAQLAGRQARILTREAVELEAEADELCAQAMALKSRYGL